MKVKKPTIDDGIGWITIGGAAGDLENEARRRGTRSR